MTFILTSDFLERAAILRVITSVKISGCSKVTVLIDQGSDVKKGAELLQQTNKQFKVLHDITHKLALVLKKELNNDPLWHEYTEYLTRTKQLVQQTELAGLQPHSQKDKGRFMNVALYIEWFGKVQESKLNGNLNHIPEERFEEYFGWMKKFEFFYDVLYQKKFMNIL